MLFQAQQALKLPIGCVTYLWRYGDNQEERCLWIWCHPAHHSLLLSVLKSIFGHASGISTVKLEDNKGKLNRFRLRGPTAHTVVSELLNADDCGVLGESLPPSAVLGLEVRDPRMLLAALRAQRVHRSTREIVPNARVSSASTLWDASVRQKLYVNRQTLTDHVINKRREELLVPGSILPQQPEEMPIPILIINAPHEGKSKTFISFPKALSIVIFFPSGFVPGCDVILPEGWATAFWHALVYCGGHPGGLKDASRMNYEHGICRDLCIEIDSVAGREEAKRKSNDLLEEYFKRPPKVRTNYIKLATPFPFGADWMLLLRTWTPTVEADFVVLRERRMLALLASKKTPTADALAPYGNYLLRVAVRVKHGCPHDHAMICLPEAGDKEGSAIEEPVHKDPNAAERKLLRQQHKSELRVLARKRKESRRRTDEVKTGEKPENGSEEMVKNYKEKIRSLWLPASDDLRKFKRPIIGFVTAGDFALSEGKGVGQGFIALSTFPAVTRRMVLVRNPGTTNYMWAELSIE